MPRFNIFSATNPTPNSAPNWACGITCCRFFTPCWNRVEARVKTEEVMRKERIRQAFFVYPEPFFLLVLLPRFNIFSATNPTPNSAPNWACDSTYCRFPAPRWNKVASSTLLLQKHAWRLKSWWERKGSDKHSSFILNLFFLEASEEHWALYLLRKTRVHKCRWHRPGDMIFRK
jgi:hypothetical protein